MPPFLLATWVGNSELQLESSLLWTPWGGRTLTLTRGLGRLLSLFPDLEICGQWKCSVGGPLWHSGVFKPVWSVNDS